MGTPLAPWGGLRDPVLGLSGANFAPDPHIPGAGAVIVSV